MANNARIFYKNKIEQLIPGITPSTEDASYLATNLYKNNYSESWRSTSNAAQDLVINFGSAIEIGALVIGNHNLTSGATVKLQANATDSWGSPSVDITLDVSDIDQFSRNFFYEFSSSETYQYWRLYVDDTGNSDAFIEIGELYLGLATELDSNYDESNSMQINRNNVEVRTEYNQAFVYTRGYNYFFDLSWTNVSKPVFDQLLDLDLYLEGSGKAFFWIPNPSEPHRAYYVRIAGTLQISKLMHNVYNLGLSLFEETPGINVPR